MSDIQSPEAIPERIKVSREPEIQHRVIEERTKLLQKNPSQSFETANAHARDRIASQITLDRIRKELIQTKQELQEAEEISNTDPLTGLKNRRWFNEELQKWMAAANRSDTSFMVLTLDFDKFKSINSQYGQEGGDQALQLIATLQSRIEEPIARLGGDEFAQLLNEDIDEEGVANIADRYIKKIAEESSNLLSTMAPIIDIDQDQRMKNFGLCIGVTKYVKDEDPKSLMHRADLAQKIAKNYPGKNRGYFAEQTEDGIVFREIKPVQEPAQELIHV